MRLLTENESMVVAGGEGWNFWEQEQFIVDFNNEFGFDFGTKNKGSIPVDGKQQADDMVAAILKRFPNGEVELKAKISGTGTGPATYTVEITIKVGAGK